MQIISNYTDYYDWVQCYGIDKGNPYYRQYNSETVDISEYDIFSRYDPEAHQKEGIKTYSKAGYIGFCGKIYPFLVIYSLEITPSKTSLYGYTKRYFDISIFYSFENIPKEFSWDKAYFDHHKDKLLPVFNTISAPVFVYKPVSFNLKTGEVNTKISIHNTKNTGRGFNTNPILAEYQFQQVFSAEDAFQEIAHYLGSDKLSAEQEQPVTDLVKIQRAGFDKKQSFRKRKHSKD